MSERITPLMNQYRQIKSRYSDAILFFQVGDFYETFYEDAREVSKLLNIALTTRDRNKKDAVPLAGVPVHAAESYISKLIQAGRKVVVCDQVEIKPGPSGVVDRVVTEIITPGTTLSPTVLVEAENNYIISVFESGGIVGFAALDVSTGEFSAGEEATLEAERILSSIRFREALLPAECENLIRLVKNLSPLCSIEARPTWAFEWEAGRKTLLEHFDVFTLSCFGLEEKKLASAAAGVLLSFVKELRRSELPHVTSIRLIVSSEHLFLDPETVRNLEIFEPQRWGDPETTLARQMDRTATAVGARELRRWLMRPSRNRETIELRLDAISELISDKSGLAMLEASMRRFPDLERLLARICSKKAGPRDLLSLAEALGRVREIAKAAKKYAARALSEATSALEVEVEASEIVPRAIDPASPAHMREAGVIKRGFREELDRLIDESESCRKWIANLQQKERRRTGIQSLKVGYNKVFGYYIEVSRVREEKIPEDYIIKQTLVSSQRYVTRELKEREQTILEAESRRLELERDIFEELCDRIAKESRKIQAIARAVAELDVLSSLARIAIERNYCRPEIQESADLSISAGRHPVVELMPNVSFIPNDTEMSARGSTFLIITGPNMGGKSTYIRQVALISLLAHIGSFVPASRAKIPLFDRIFTRVGSSDNLARGKSTFLVEMAETAKILHQCTSKSLVILDEIGRGTSTLDGLSIAWAVSEFLLENEARRPMTLFATHFHELTSLAEKYPYAKNLRVEVREWGDEIFFLHTIKEGSSDRSYGIHVAKLAGLPASVVRRSKEILSELEKPKMELPLSGSSHQASLFDECNTVFNILKNIEIDRLTPLEALEIIAELKKLLGE